MNFPPSPRHPVTPSNLRDNVSAKMGYSFLSKVISRNKNTINKREKVRYAVANTPYFWYIFSRKLPKQITPILLAIFANLVAFPVLANSVEIRNHITDKDQVTLKVRVINDERLPIAGLTVENFEIKTTLPNGKEVSLKDKDITITPPEEIEPDPAYLVILLDMSGSMRHKDKSGTIKLKGAVDGIQDFIDTIEAENLPVTIALVPFGERGRRCNYGYEVNQKIIENSLEEKPYTETKSYLRNLAGVNVCAATDLYQPLTEAVEFLGTSLQDSESYQKKSSSQFPPRLGVILFTDGFDVDRSDEAKRFKELKDLLNKETEVAVHTMGYGESLVQLRDRANCSPDSFYYVSNQSLTVDNLLKRCDLNRNNQKIEEFIVDENRLTQIADITREGIAKFPQDSDEVIDSLKTFLLSLREYEITYRQPGADRAGFYETKVIVNAPDQGLNNLATTPPEKVRLDNFIYSSLSPIERGVVGILTVILLVGGIFRFNNWSKNLKKEAKKNLYP